MTRCPLCFTPLPEHRYFFMCRAGCELEPDEIASAHVGAPHPTPPMCMDERTPGDKRWRPPSAVACPTCDVLTDQQACPTCHWTLPAGWRDFDTTCVAAAGARHSGKSVYIAVLKKQLDERGRRLGFLPDGIGDTDDRYRRYYESTLWDERGRLFGGTSSAWDDESRLPLMYQISGGDRHERPHVLVIRDIAGENLENPQLAEGHYAAYSFMGRADALFFLMDPLQVPGVQARLRGHVPPQTVGDDPVIVLGNLLRLLKEQPSQALATRVAIVISKFDAIQALSKVQDPRWQAPLDNPGAAIRRDPSLDEPSFDAIDADLLHEEIRSLLERLGASSLTLKAKADIPRARLFAISALGHGPNGHFLSERGIAPFRVLDPLKWALSGDPGRAI